MNKEDMTEVAVIRSIISKFVVIQSNSKLLIEFSYNAYHYMCVCCVENVSTALTYVALNVLEILMPCVNSVDIYIVFENGSKALSPNFPKLFSD